MVHGQSTESPTFVGMCNREWWTSRETHICASEMARGNSPECGSVRPKLRWYWKWPGIALLAFTAFYVMMPALDSIAVESLQCKIVSAKAESSSGGTRGSASTAGVLIETSNCGQVHISRGVSFDSQDAVASSFSVGSEYEFDLGWFSRVVTKDIRKGIPTALEYRVVR